jgi:hypothetical protein
MQNLDGRGNLLVELKTRCRTFSINFLHIWRCISSFQPWDITPIWHRKINKIKMFHPFSFRCSNHASTTPFPSLFLPNTTSFHLAGQSPTFPFSRRQFNPPSLRSVLPLRAVASSSPLFDISGGKGYVYVINSPQNSCL